LNPCATNKFGFGPDGDERGEGLNEAINWNNSSKQVQTIISHLLSVAAHAAVLGTRKLTRLI
jgi:hypothetical protein